MLLKFSKMSLFWCTVNIIQNCKIVKPELCSETILSFSDLFCSSIATGSGAMLSELLFFESLLFDIPLFKFLLFVSTEEEES